MEKDMNTMSWCYLLADTFQTHIYIYEYNKQDVCTRIYATALHTGFQKIRHLLLLYTKQTNAHTALKNPRNTGEGFVVCLGKEMGVKTTGKKRTSLSEFITGTQKKVCIRTHTFIFINLVY